ncbi:MAG: hypothetical protein AAFY26_06160 [Cyanobacteria bacterium J06638_22]
MSKTPSEQPQNSQPQSSNDELLEEYRFDYRRAKPNRFAAHSDTQPLTVVVLDEDVAQVFKTPEAVNRVKMWLRSLKHPKLSIGF